MKKSIGSFFLSFNLGKDQVSEECQDYSCKVDQLFLYILTVSPDSRLEKTRSSCFPSRPRSGTILSELPRYMKRYLLLIQSLFPNERRNWRVRLFLRFKIWIDLHSERMEWECALSHFAFNSWVCLSIFLDFFSRDSQKWNSSARACPCTKSVWMK